MYADRKLRALQRLAERTEGAELERVLAMIGRRRRQLEQELDPESELWSMDFEQAPIKRWTPEAGFEPSSADAVPIKVRRPGKRGFRIVGVRRDGGT